MHETDPAASAFPERETVSVIMPCFNAETTIVRAVASVMAQTHRPVELIVVDDASTDGSIPALRDAFPNSDAIRIVELPHNGGPARARNAGLDRSRGDWIALLDTDDAWRPGRLASMLSGAGNADAVFDNLVGYDQIAAAETGALFPSFPTGVLTIAALLAPRVKGSRYDFGYLKPIMRREFLTAHKLRYDESLRTSEDLAFYLRMLLAGARAALLDDPGYIYTTPVGHRSDQISLHSKSTPHDDQLRLVLEALLGQHRNRLPAKEVAAIEQRIAHLKSVAPLAKFYHARRHSDFAQMARLLVSNGAVRRDVATKLYRRVCAGR